MLPVRLSLLLAAWCPVAALVLPAQGTPLAAGIRAADAHDLPLARRDFEAVLRADPASYEANWRLALLLIDLAKQTPDRIRSPARDSTYRQASLRPSRHRSESRRRRRTFRPGQRPRSREPEHVGAGARIEVAKEVRAEALRAIQLDAQRRGMAHPRPLERRGRAPAPDGAAVRPHVSRASVFGSASWDEAERDLRLAVEYAPAKIVHHFDLAMILAWRHEWAAAKQQLDIVAQLPSVDVSDTSYKRQARDLMSRVLGHLSQMIPEAVRAEARSLREQIARANRACSTSSTRRN